MTIPVPTAFTVLGASGFVGAALVAALDSAGHRVRAVTRGALPALLETRRDAGHVIDCIGLTGDFRDRPYDTAEAHVGITARCLANLRCESFLFLSSTRVYARSAAIVPARSAATIPARSAATIPARFAATIPARSAATIPARSAATHEEAHLTLAPADPSDLYNLTKLTGEALCLADPRRAVRVVRLSNVYGADMPADTFLGQVLREGRSTGAVRFRQSADSAKDYVSLAQVTRLLPAIASGGRERLYNLAAGSNTSHAAIAAVLRRDFGWHVDFAPGAPTVQFPPIDTARLTAEFGAALSNLSADLATLVADGQEVQCSPSMNEAAG